jgi:DNA-binding response OmpR family regulator
MARILVVEDEIALAEAYTFLFRHQGHKVTVAYDGEEALQKVSKAKFDLLIVDMMMPHLDGLGFLRRYKGQTNPTPKILILSNLTSRDYEEEAFKLGASRYEIKAGLSPPSLLKVVDDLLG